MNSVFFSRLSGVRLALGEVVTKYVDWVIGDGAYRRRRGTRLQQGIAPQWPTGALMRGGTFNGQFDLSVVTRRDATTFALRFTHRDTDNGAVLWHNFVRLTEHQGAVTIEHAVARTAPRDEQLQPTVACPRILRDIGTNPRAGNSDGFRGSVTALTESLVDDFIKYELLSSSRQRPVVLISPHGVDSTPLVRPDKLANALFGMASVVALSDSSASRAWTAALEKRGFDERFGCYGGAIRIYRAPLTIKDDLANHPLLIRARVEEFPPEKRDALVTGLIGQRIVRGTIPPTFPSLIEDFDRAQQRLFIERIRSAAPAASLAEAHSRIADLEKVIADSNELVNSYSSDAKQAQEDLLRAQEQFEELEEQRRQAVAERDSKSQVIDTLNQRLEAASQGALAADTAKTRELLFALAENANPEMQVRVFELLYPNQVHVLDSARKSARQSSDFRFPKVCFSLLHRLVDGYWAALATGKGTVEARHVFGKDEYASTESEPVQNNAGAMKRRTFSYAGSDIQFLSHLKHGAKDSVYETLRIHFHWDAAKKLIVIGHCGPHLDFS